MGAKWGTGVDVRVLHLSAHAMHRKLLSIHRSVSYVSFGKRAKT